MMDDEELTTEEAKKIIEQERNQRAAICTQEISRILQAYNCSINAIPRIDNGRIVADINITAQE